MKRSTIIILVIVAAVAIWAISAYNSMVKMEEGVESAWAQVENVYQRRADLIPNLVATVKGYAAHESETLESVIAARSKATQITVDPQDLSAEALKKYQAAQGELGAALGKLLAFLNLCILYLLQPSISPICSSFKPCFKSF
ncbi:MAG: LemA family protein, partial [Bacteroidales bacterium]|nr:LemA family protein [Bacteroidales bacterium]